jgi:hypothetical protein
LELGPVGLLQSRNAILRLAIARHRKLHRDLDDAFLTSPFLKEQAMSHKQYSLSKQLVAAAALALGMIGLALADDNSVNPYTGDSHANFNNGNASQSDRPSIGKTQLTFRQTNPHGLSFNEYNALAAPNAPEWQPAPVIDKTPSSFHKDNPHGLSFNQYNALAAPNAPEWQPAPVIDKKPSSFHKDFPHGLPFSYYETLSDQ